MYTIKRLLSERLSDERYEDIGNEFYSRILSAVQGDASKLPWKKAKIPYGAEGLYVTLSDLGMTDIGSKLNIDGDFKILFVMGDDMEPPPDGMYIPKKPKGKSQVEKSGAMVIGCTDYMWDESSQSVAKSMQNHPIGKDTQRTNNMLNATVYAGEHAYQDIGTKGIKSLIAAGKLADLVRARENLIKHELVHAYDTQMRPAGGMPKRMKADLKIDTSKYYGELEPVDPLNPDAYRYPKQLVPTEDINDDGQRQYFRSTGEVNAYGVQAISGLISAFKDENPEPTKTLARQWIRNGSDLWEKFYLMLNRGIRSYMSEKELQKRYAGRVASAWERYVNTLPELNIYCSHEESLAAPAPRGLDR